MKAIGLFLFVTLMFLSCDKNDDYQNEFKLNSVSYESSYSIESRPISILFNKNKKTLYIANLNYSSNNYSAKIQSFSENGSLVKTVVDFDTFSRGRYFHYSQIDIAFDNDYNLYVLVQPLIEQTDETWITPTGFSILKFDSDDNFKQELDFSEIDGESRPSSISYFDNKLYTCNSKIIKQIDIETLQLKNITIPLKDNESNTWPYLLTSDMEINSKGIIYLTGQATSGTDSVGCHISRYNLDSDELIIDYSNGWTWMCCARVNNPGICINDNGYLYLASFYQMNLEIYNDKNEFVFGYDTRSAKFEDTRPIDIEYYNGKIYVADELNNQIHIFKQD